MMAVGRRKRGEGWCDRRAKHGRPSLTLLPSGTWRVHGTAAVTSHTCVLQACAKCHLQQRRLFVDAARYIEGTLLWGARVREDEGKVGMAGGSSLSLRPSTPSV